MPSRSFLNARLDPPDLISQNQQEQSESLSQTTSAADRTIALPLAPAGIESRVMVADRVKGVWQPDTIYAEQDHNKGGAPGSPGGAPGGPDPEQDAFISGQSPTGATIDGYLPPSQLKLSYGVSDMTSPQPTFLPM